MVLNKLKSKIFQLLAIEGSGHPGMLSSNPSEFNSQLKLLSSKQILQRLPIVLAIVQAGNASENLLNEIRTYSFYRTKEITKKVYNNIINSIVIIQNGYYIYEF